VYYLFQAPTVVYFIAWCSLRCVWWGFSILSLFCCSCGDMW